MGFVAEYLQSTLMTQELAKLMTNSISNNPDYANKQLVYALFRWYQWFENPYVNKTEIKLSEPTKIDFRNYCAEVFYLLKQKNISEQTLHPKINQVLTGFAKKLLAPGHDFNERFVKLITMGACEYHGFNSYFTDSIQEYGLDTKHETKQPLENIYQILKRVGASTNYSRFKHDDKIYVTNDPSVAYLHSLMSPKWFCYFNRDTVAPFINSDHDLYRQNLFNFAGAKNLTDSERAQIYTFFQNWWDKLVTPDRQKIAVMPMFRTQNDLQSRYNINRLYAEKFGFEKLINGALYSTYERTYEKPIQPQFIKIFDIPSTEIHQQRLTKLKQDFQKANQSLKQQADTINALNTDKTAEPNDQLTTA